MNPACIKKDIYFYTPVIAIVHIELRQCDHRQNYYKFVNVWNNSII